MNKYQRKISNVSWVLESLCWNKLKDEGYYNGYDYSEYGLFNTCRETVRKLVKENKYNTLSEIQSLKGENDKILFLERDKIVEIYISNLRQY